MSHSELNFNWKEIHDKMFEAIKEHEDEMQSKKTEYESEVFHKVINYIREYLKDNDDLSSEGIKYSPEDYNITQDELWYTFYDPAVMEFQEGEFEYEDLVFDVWNGCSGQLTVRKKDGSI